MELVQKRNWLREASGYLYACCMETAWNWNGQPAEVVRAAYEIHLGNAINSLDEIGLTDNRIFDIYNSIKRVKELDKESLIPVMKTMHYSARALYNDMENEIKRIEKEIDTLSVL